MLLLIKNGLLPLNGTFSSTDILIKDGAIVKIHPDIEKPIAKVQIIDASGTILLPGGIDPHVHLSLSTPAGNTSDDFSSGSLAALAGGTTTIIDFVTPDRHQSLIQTLNERKVESENCHCDYGFHMGITRWDRNIPLEIEQCISHGITSFKIYLAYQDSIGIGYEELEKIMKAVSTSGGLLMAHCEEGDEISKLQQQLIKEGETSPLFLSRSRPAVTEANAIRKAIGLANTTKCPLYIVHVSAAESVDVIRQAKTNRAIFAETCPHYLLLDDSVYSLPVPEVLNYFVCPPLRSKNGIEQLLSGLADLTFDTLATDHCPFKQRNRQANIANGFAQIPNGVGGIEQRLRLLYTFGVKQNLITMERFVELISTNAAKIFGLYPRKGALLEGSDADIVLWDGEASGTISAATHFQNCDSNIYEGMKTSGTPVYVIADGKIVLVEGQFRETLPKGKFLKRELCNI